MRRSRQPARQRHQAGGDAAQQREHRDRGGDEHGRDPLVIGKPDRDRDQQRDHHRHQREIAPARAMPFAGDLLAKQRRDRHVVHPAERPQSEGERGQQAVDERQRQFVEMQRRDHRQRQQLAEHADDDERQRRAGGKPDHRADPGEHDHLRQIDREDVAAGGAERLERGDDVAAAIDVALDGVGDADAADQKRGEADQRQELGEAADGALELRRGVAAAADPPAGFRQGARARCRSAAVAARSSAALSGSFTR